MNKFFIDIAAAIFSLIALSLSLYQFAYQSVRLNLITTDITAIGPDVMQFNVAFQNYGNVHLLVSEVEIFELHDDRQTSNICTSGRPARPPQTVRPIDAGWFQVVPGEFANQSFGFDFEDPGIGRKSFCIRVEVHDIFGGRYEEVVHMAGVDVFVTDRGQIRLSNASITEAPQEIANANYLLRW